MKIWSGIGFTVRDGFTIIERQRQDPLLENRLIDDALMYRELLDNGLVAPDVGIDYFLTFLRGYSLKGAAEGIPSMRSFDRFQFLQPPKRKS